MSNSRRDADIGESYYNMPRVNSVHLRTTYSRLIQVSNNINFNTPVFDGMAKRNRSLGSAQAFIVELALSNPSFVDRLLKPFMLYGGENLMLGQDYMDRVYFDRLATYKHIQQQKR